MGWKCTISGFFILGGVTVGSYACTSNQICLLYHSKMDKVISKPLHFADEKHLNERLLCFFLFFLFSLNFGDSKDTCAPQVRQLIFKCDVVSKSKGVHQTFVSIRVLENIVHTDKPLAICRSAVWIKP